MGSELKALTPPADGNGKSQVINLTSTAAIVLQSATGGVEAPTDAGTGTFPTRYPQALVLTAITGNAWIRFGGSSVGTATNTTAGWDVFCPASVPILYRRPVGSTHYRVIADATGTLQIGVNEGYAMQESS